MSVDVRYLGGNKIEVVKEYGNVPTALNEIKFGIPYYIVVVNYTTGDTFGSQDAQEYVELFESGNLAAELVRLITEDAEDYDKERMSYYNKSNHKYSGADSYYLDYIVDSGETRQTAKIWNGYFESLNDASIDVVWRTK